MCNQFHTGRQFTTVKWPQTAGAIVDSERICTRYVLTRKNWTKLVLYWRCFQENHWCDFADVTEILLSSFTFEISQSILYLFCYYGSPSVTFSVLTQCDSHISFNWNADFLSIVCHFCTDIKQGVNTNVFHSCLCTL